MNPLPEERDVHKDCREFTVAGFSAPRLDAYQLPLPQRLAEQRTTSVLLNKTKSYYIHSYKQDPFSDEKWRRQISFFWEVLREVRDFITELLCIATLHYTLYKSGDAYSRVPPPPFSKRLCGQKRHFPGKWQPAKQGSNNYCWGGPMHSL